MLTLHETLDRRRYARLGQQVCHLDEQMRQLPDQALPERYVELRRRRRKGAELTELVPEMFALVREACRRAIGIHQWEVQVRAAVALSEGRVVEMQTGEGKTFVAPLAAALYALDQRGVHVVTANDYLAGRDARVLAPAYNMLGLKVGCVLADTQGRERASAYLQDITYTTVPQLGFDFLRQFFQQSPDTLRKYDMWQYLKSEIDGSTRESRCLRGRYYAILDEVDSILVDYARKPLSLSVEAESQRPLDVYQKARQYVLDVLQEEQDYKLDKVRMTAELTDKGKKHVTALQQDYGYLHQMDSDWEERLEEALSAEHLLKKGVDYVVQGPNVWLVDQTSGRLMIGQRMGGDLHQALECKEGVPVQPRQRVAKKITVQSLIRPYEHLAGMTGTAWEARSEFSGVYGMKTVRFEPRLPERTDFRPDVVFPDSEARWEAVVEDIVREHARGQPILLGSRSVDSSQHLSDMLKARGVPHEVLNAVNHAREAEIIALAGQKGSVTVSTNMAGRGVEITLGEGVPELGGLHVIGAERHTLDRVDRQLSGRTGRRGQPGSVQFYASLDDDVFQVLPDGTRQRLKRRYSRSDGQPIPAGKLDGLIRHSQRKFSKHFAQMRRVLLIRDLAQEEGDKILFGKDSGL